MSVPDKQAVAELGEEPEGFWDDVHAEVDSWIEKYAERADDVGTD